MLPLDESYEHLGSVPVYIYDLHPFWERIKSQRREYVIPELASAVARVRVPAPPAVTWDIFTNPATRGLIIAGEVSASDYQNGRLGVGSMYHCAHHDGTSGESAILGWQPLEYVTTRVLAHEPCMTISFLMTCWLEAQPDGTSLVTISLGLPQAEDPAQQAMLEAMWPQASQELIHHLEQHATAAYAQIVAERDYLT